VRSVGLHILATKAVFDVFDMDNNGVVSPVEFISTMVQFNDLHPSNANNSHAPPSAGGAAAATATATTTTTTAAAAVYSRDADSKDAPFANTDASATDGTLSPSGLARQASQDEKQGSHEEFTRTKLYFSLFDLDGNGYISRDELAYVIGMLMTENERHPRDSPTGSGDGGSSYHEEHMSPERTSRQSFRNAYNVVPSDALEHWKKQNPEMNAEVDDDMNIPDTFRDTDDEIDYTAIFNDIDTDGSGEICFDEFSIWFNNGKNKDLFQSLVDPSEQMNLNLEMFYK